VGALAHRRLASRPPFRTSPVYATTDASVPPRDPPRCASFAKGVGPRACNQEGPVQPRPDAPDVVAAEPTDRRRDRRSCWTVGRERRDHERLHRGSPTGKASTRPKLGQLKLRRADGGGRPPMRVVRAAIDQSTRTRSCPRGTPAVRILEGGGPRQPVTSRGKVQQRTGEPGAAAASEAFHRRAAVVQSVGRLGRRPRDVAGIGGLARAGGEPRAGCRWFVEWDRGCWRTTTSSCCRDYFGAGSSRPGSRTHHPPLSSCRCFRVEDKRDEVFVDSRSVIVRARRDAPDSPPDRKR